MAPHMLRRPLAISLGVSVLLLPRVGAHADVVCVFEAGTLTVELGAPVAPVTVARDGESVVVLVAGEELGCEGAPTIHTTDRIHVVNLAPAGATVILDLSGGPFEPGASPEPGDPEIELEVDLGGFGTGELAIVGGEDAEHIALGAAGIELNASEPVRDVDLVAVGVERHVLRLGGGDDELDAGGASSGSPFPLRLIVQGDGGNDLLVGGSGADRLDGGPGSDAIEGGPGDDELLGGGGPDELSGGAGDDLLDGGTGSDLEQGGTGDDVFDQGAAANGSDVLLGEAMDDVVAYDARTSPVTVDLSGAPMSGQAGEGDAVEQVEVALGGPQGDVLVGDDGANVLRGGGGDDSLSGEAGDDVLAGGPGDDDLHGGPGRDAVSAFSATGPVTIDLSAGTLSGQGEDTLVGVENAVGGPFDDLLRGDADANELHGHGGMDRLEGGAGDDALDGGSEDDVLLGEEGDDVLAGGWGRDQLHGGAGGDVIGGGPDADTAVFRSAGSAVLVDLALGSATGQGSDLLEAVEHVEGSRFADVLVGDAAANTLRGRGGDDVLRGRGGSDRLVGGMGDDTLAGGPGADLFEAARRVDGADRILPGPGADVVTYARRRRPVRVALDRRAGDGAAGEGDEVGPGVREVRGGRGPDVLVGDGRANVLVGGAGGDVLRGRGGRDRLLGGPGADRLDGGPGRDLCLPGPGRDRVRRCERPRGVTGGG